MSRHEKNQNSNAIREAIREKCERKPIAITDINELEALLLADIEAFDLDAAERLAQHEQLASAIAGVVDVSPAFPEIVPFVPARKPPAPTLPASAPPISQIKNEGAGLLGKLRQQAELQQREAHSAQVMRSASNKLIDQALKHIFFYLHDLVQQLNILKPGIPREYSMADGVVLGGFAWHEGFADYRTQAQSAGALVEVVSFSYQMHAPDCVVVERDGPAVERFRRTLFDYGIQFACKEFKNDRRYVERAEFQISNQLSVSVRWKADFDRGLLVFESRNLERLGTVELSMLPTAVDFTLLEEFGRLALGQPSRFRALTKR